MSHVEIHDHWLAEICKNGSFVDVGGLWGLVGERVTLAASNGATRLTMVDHCPAVDPMWTAFHARCAHFGVTCRCLAVDVEDEAFTQVVEEHDIVYCNGLIYHSPHPVKFLSKLRSITRSKLVLGSVVLLPEASIPGTSVFVPALTTEQRQALSSLYRFNSGPAVGIDCPVESWAIKDSKHDAVPYWWLHTQEVLSAALLAVGFNVERVCSAWDGRCRFFQCGV